MKNNTAVNKPPINLARPALIFMTLLWGATFVVVKESLNDVSSMLFLTLRFGLASVVLILLMIVYKIKFDKKTIAPGLFLGVFLYLIFVTQTIGLKYTTATNSGFITGSSVVMVPFVQMIVQKKNPSKSAIIGCILVFIGILFLSSGGNSISGFLSQFGANFNLGDALTLLCAIFVAIHIVYIGILSRDYNNWLLLLIQLVVVTVLSLAASFIFSGFNIEQVHVNFSNYLIFGIVYTAIFTTLITIGLQLKYQKYVTPTQAGIIYALEPLFAAIFAFFLLNEKIGMFGLIGCVLIFLGLVVSEAFNSPQLEEARLHGESGNPG
jgi:drug/metabolite transporter (DMT)-like permease